MRRTILKKSQVLREGYKQGLKRAQRIIAESFEERKFKVSMSRTVDTYVVVIADSEEEAGEMCQIGIEVKENGNLSARSDYEEFVVDYGAESSYDDIESIEEV